MWHYFLLFKRLWIVIECVVRTVRGLLAQGFEDLIMAKQACNDNCWSGEWDDFYTEVKNFSCCDYTHTKVDVLNGPEYDLLNAVA